MQTTGNTHLDDFELDDNVDLYGRFLDSLQGSPWCNRTSSTSTSTHISSIPAEVFLIIARWIVSNELDVQSLERSALACKGFYLFARDPKLWRLVCRKVWGDRQLGELGGSYTSWRQMFFYRSRLRFNGCYISRTEYFRLGDNSFQDTSYKPVHHVEYYRYLRFFPDGLCLMLTTADEPPIGVKKLKSRTPSRKEIMRGSYRLDNDRVAIALQRKLSLEVPVAMPEKRSRAAPPPPSLSCEQTFHIDLQIQGSTRKRFNQLHWLQYRLTQRRNSIESSSDFHLTQAKYPALYFSRVEHYAQETDSILE